MDQDQPSVIQPNHHIDTHTTAIKSHKVLYIGISAGALIIAAAALVYWYGLRLPVLELSTSPAGATVELDGKPVHTTRLSITPHEHTLKATAPGYVAYSKTFTASRGKTHSIQVLLKPIPAPIVLSNDVDTAPSFINGSEIYFLGNKGKTLYRTRNNQGEISQQILPMTPDTLSDIKQVIWRPDGQVTFLKRSDGIYLYDFMRYDLLHQTMTLWGTGIDQIAWDPKSTRTIYTYYAADGQESLKFADIQNKNTTIVANLAEKHIDHPSLEWAPNGELITLVPQSAQKKTNYLYLFDIFTKKITQLTDTGEVQGAKWSPDSQKIAYVAPGKDVNGKDTMIVWIANADESGVRPLNVTTSSIDKVAWNGDSKSLVAVDESSSQKKLVNITLEGQVTDYQYQNVKDGFDPHYLNVMPNDQRALFIDHSSFVTLPLVTGSY